MKQLIRCMRCDKMYPISLCYQAEIPADVESAIDHEIVNQKREGHICAVCNKILGFKTNDEKYKEAQRIYTL